MLIISDSKIPLHPVQETARRGNMCDGRCTWCRGEICCSWRLACSKTHCRTVEKQVSCDLPSCSSVCWLSITYLTLTDTWCRYFSFKLIINDFFFGCPQAGTFHGNLLARSLSFNLLYHIRGAMKWMVVTIGSMLVLLYNLWIPFQIIACTCGYLICIHACVIMVLFIYACDNILNKIQIQILHLGNI